MVDKTPTGKLIFSKEKNERNKKLRDFILNLISKNKNSRECDLLEIGCGNGRFENLLSTEIKSYTGIDPLDEYIKLARETTKRDDSEYFIGSAEEIPLKKKFDIILYALSWHFVSDFKKAIQETKRVLEKDGLVIIIEPSKESNSWVNQKLVRGSPEFDEKMYLRKIKSLDNANDKLELFEQNGFEIKKEKRSVEDHLNVWTLNLKTPNVP